jgi:outer membrane murein-binding lipoprotein Lpp
LDDEIPQGPHACTGRGALYGFAAILVTLFVAGIGASNWLGSLDTRVSGLDSRMERNEHDNSALASDMRTRLDAISQQLSDLRVLIAASQNAHHH